MNDLRRGLIVGALVLFPLSSLIGGLLWLLWWLLPYRASAVEATLPVGSRWKPLFWLFVFLSLVPLLTSALPLWHLAGWLSRYGLPVLLIGSSYRALISGRLAATELVTGLLAGSLLLAGIGLGNYFLHWQTHLQALCFGSFGGFCLLDLLLLAEDRARSFSMHPNVLGILLAVSLPLWLYALAQTKKNHKIPVLAGLLLVLLALLVSFSRAAWLGGGLALGLGLFWLMPLSLLTLPLAVAGLWVSGGQDLLSRRLGGLLAAEGSQISRLRLWEGGLRMLQEHLLCGTGLLQVEALIPAYVGSLPGGAGHLHDWYLQVAVESGLPAALLVFALLALLLGRPGQLPLARSCWLAWAGFGLASLFDVTILDLRVAFVMSLLLALLLQQRAADLAGAGDSPGRQTE